MRLAGKSGRVYHARNPQWERPYANGSWKTQCSKDLPEITPEEIRRRKLFPCRICFGGKPPTD